MLEENKDLATKVLKKSTKVGILNPKLSIETVGHISLYNRGLQVTRILEGRGSEEQLARLEGKLRTLNLRFVLDINTEPGIGDKCPDLELVNLSNSQIEVLDFKDDFIYLLIF